MAGTSDDGARPFDAAYPVEDGIVWAHPGRAERLPARGAAGWLNDRSLTAWAYEPLWRHRSVSILTLGAASTAFELRTLRRWLATALGPTAAGAVARPAVTPRAGRRPSDATSSTGGADEPLAGRWVLDVGCSAGLYARTLTADGAVAYALDASPAFLRAGRRTAPQDGRAPTWVHGDAHALPFVAGVFDAAVVGATVNEFADPERAFGEMGRVLRAGGVVWTMYARRALGPARAAQWLLERGGLRFPTPETVDAWAAAAGLAPLRRAVHGAVAFALYRKGAGAPPLAVSSPSPGWEAGPSSAAGAGPSRPPRGAPSDGQSSAT